VQRALLSQPDRLNQPVPGCHVSAQATQGWARTSSPPPRALTRHPDAKVQER